MKKLEWGGGKREVWMGEGRVVGRGGGRKGGGGGRKGREEER